MQTQTDNQTNQNSIDNPIANIPSSTAASTSSSITPIPSSVGSDQGGHGPSKIFYLILGVTIFVFLGVLLVVVLSVTNNLHLSSNKPVIPTLTPVSLPSTTSGAESSDSATTALLQQKNSDEVGDIESDVVNTNLSNLDEGTASIEAALP